MGKNHKKDKDKKKKAKHKHRHRHRSSSSSSTSSEEWVEKEMSLNASDSSKIREEWMMMDTCFGGKTRKELQEEKQKGTDNLKEEVNILDCPGQSVRELNPFWKNGGTGLPSESLEAKKTSSCIRVGDNGVKWLRKALERAKEKAEEEGRNLDDVISERWGSLSEFNKLLKDAEKNDKNYKYNRHDDREKYSNRHKDKNDRGYKYDNNKKRLNFRKPDEESYTRSYSENTYRSHESKPLNKNWKKPTTEDNVKKETSKGRTERRPSPEIENAERSCEQPNSTPLGSSSDDANVKILSINELNHLFAAAWRAEFSGNKSLARKLESEANSHKLRRENALENKEFRDENPDKVVFLTETDNRGFTRPMKSLEGSSKGKRKAETHEGQKRIRYFADDDKYSLQDMFEREKYNSVEDDQNMFLKLVEKEQKDDMDDEGVFDKARMDQSSSEDAKKRAKAINKYKTQEKALEHCRWCVGSKQMLDVCIIVSKSKVYLAAPTSQSLTEKHCLIIPHSHVPCGTLLDEDVWEEVMELRKKIVQNLSDEEDVIFFEIANNLHKHPHMVLHCVIVPKEFGDTAPIYFKKAILECETEWSNNKKVVDLAGRDVRKAVPKGLAYFSVDFGMQSGYAHVIEDNRLFPTNFGQEIIGGMLDLDHTIWRKPRRDSTENIIKKVELIKQWLFEENT